MRKTLETCLPALGSETGEKQSEEIPVVQMQPFENSFLKESEAPEKSWAALLNFFLLSFAGGIAALLTPCVFPIIPDPFYPLRHFPRMAQFLTQERGLAE